MAVVVTVTGSGVRKRWFKAASCMAEHGLQNYSDTIFALTDDFMAGYERKRHPGLKVAGRLAVYRGQVGTADPSEPGVYPVPARAWEFDIWRFHQS